jgi:proline dehydrogenase
VALLIDGEESWMQDAADDLVTNMMRKSAKKPIVLIIHYNCIVGIV